MRKHFFLVASFVCFSEFLLGLPQDHSVVSGDVKIHHTDPHTMVVNASDKSIIQYKKFNIKQGEKVQFVQPSSSSSVLARVEPGKVSKILGHLESNGKVFLVNPNGIYFGPNASVRVGSLVASTLDISNEDFVKDTFRFFLNNKDSLSEIRNDGLLAASPEGAIVLMAPIIRNLGTIQAQAGKVVLAAGESVTLDFHGDKLLQFSVEGDLKGAILEQLGSIHAENGEVSMKLPTAKRAIHEIVNRDGLERGEVFVEENGEIFLVSASSIQAKRVALEASTVKVEGTIQASSLDGLGGSISVAGADISVKGALIDASGKLGGGEVLIGGEYQGKGSMPYASKVLVDHSSTIVANATEQGDGGSVVLWSKDRTSFEGKIFSKGGSLGGNGGIVESSSMVELSVLQGFVDTSASLGKMGQWLLDPGTLHIVAGGTANPGCVTSGSASVGATAIEGASSTVVLCAHTIYQEVSLSMTVQGAGIIFTPPILEQGLLYLGHDITTIGGAVIARNLDTILTGDLTIDTTAGATYLPGGDIAFNKINSDATPRALTLDSGLSAGVTLVDGGSISPLGTVTIRGQSAFLYLLSTRSQPISVVSPILLLGDAIFSTVAGGGNGAAISLPVIDANTAGIQSLLIEAGIGEIQLAAIGVTTPVRNFEIRSGGPLVGISNIVTQGGFVQIVPSILLANPVTEIRTFSPLNNLLGGNVLLGDVHATVANQQSLGIDTGLKANVSFGNIGGATIPLDNVRIQLNQLFEVGSVHASDMNVAGGAGRALLKGEIVLTSSEGLSIDSGSILLDAPITVEKLNLTARESILNVNGPHPINVNNTGTVYLSSSHRQGSIGTPSNPIELNAEGYIQVGGKSVNLSGTHSVVNYIAGNTPCFIRIKGDLVGCAVAPRAIFFSLPTSLTGRTILYNNNLQMLGLHPVTPQTYNGVQSSQYGPIELTLDHLSSPPKPI